MRAGTSGKGTAILAGGCCVLGDGGDGLGTNIAAGEAAAAGGGNGAGMGSDRGVSASMAAGASALDVIVASEDIGLGESGDSINEVASADEAEVASVLGGSGNKSRFDWLQCGHTCAR